MIGSLVSEVGELVVDVLALFYVYYDLADGMERDESNISCIWAAFWSLFAGRGNMSCNVCTMGRHLAMEES
jgi:hypothetical protein